MRTSRAAAAAASLPLLLLVALLVAAEGRRHKDGSGDEEAKACDKGWECSGSRFCCNDTITDYFKAYQFEELFAHRNDRSLAHAAGFWDYHAFITAAALFEPRGFGTTGGKEVGMKEVAAFLGHVGAKTSCTCAALLLLLLADRYCDFTNLMLRGSRNRLGEMDELVVDLRPTVIFRIGALRSVAFKI